MSALPVIAQVRRQPSTNACCASLRMRASSAITCRCRCCPHRCSRCRYWLRTQPVELLSWYASQSQRPRRTRCFAASATMERWISGQRAQPRPPGRRSRAARSPARPVARSLRRRRLRPSAEFRWRRSGPARGFTVFATCISARVAADRAAKTCARASGVFRARWRRFSGELREFVERRAATRQLRDWRDYYDRELADWLPNATEYSPTLDYRFGKIHGPDLPSPIGVARKRRPLSAIRPPNACPSDGRGTYRLGNRTRPSPTPLSVGGARSKGCVSQRAAKRSARAIVSARPGSTASISRSCLRHLSGAGADSVCCEGGSTPRSD